MKAANAEGFLVTAVQMGLLEVDDQGRIWKVAERRGNRWNGEATIRPVLRRRAEKDQGIYLQVRWMVKGKRVSVLAHRLVWTVLNGPIPEGLVINHLNGIKKDNRPENLELTTHSGNQKHAHRTGLRVQTGERNPNSKLTDLVIAQIRTAYADGEATQAELAVIHGVSFKTISKIVRGERRTTQPGPTADYTDRRRISSDYLERDESGRFLGR